MKEFNITLIQPENYLHSFALLEAAEYMKAMLIECGYLAKLTRNALLPNCYNVLLGAHLLGECEVNLIPANSIIFNSEQIEDAAGWHFESGVYKRVLRQFHIWDYSSRNINLIEHQRKDLIPFLYCSALKREPAQRQQGRTLLFYGAMTPRRQRIVDELREAKVDVTVLFGMYAMQRDRHLFNAWAVLNLHKADDTTPFEPIRCFYPLINGIPVISELSSSDEAAEPYADSIFFLNEKSFVENIRSLYMEPARFAQTSKAHIEAFQRKSAVGHIRVAVHNFLQKLN